MNGRRLPDIAIDNWTGTYPMELQPGDYFKLGQSMWMLKAPNGDEGMIRATVHKISVNEDGAISVTPSIQFLTGKHWHGFLEGGIWRSV